MIRRLLIMCAVLLPAAVAAQSESERVEAILSRLSLQDKLGQLNQLDGRTDLEKLKERIRRGELSSVMNITDPAVLDELQRTAVEESPAGIPLLFARDVVHGFRTVLPIPLGQAASFDEDLVELTARNTAAEATAHGIRWAFAPMMDIARDARWGRIAESFGEDTHLSSRLAAAVVRGYQGESLSSPLSMAACAKHFVAYGAAEGGRDYNTTYVPERAMRDVYLPPFKASVDAGCASVMASFNDNDGLPSTGNRRLLTEILREEWGFDGVTVSDWGSVTGLIPHGIAADRREAAAKSIAAGLDMDMSSMAYLTEMQSLVESGEVPVEAVDEAVRRVLTLKMRLGLFDNPYSRKASADEIYSEQTMDDARRLAEESVVLLKNSGVLPLGPNVRRILVAGPMADAPYDQLGTWTLDGEKSRTITPVEALRTVAGDSLEIVFIPALTHPRDLSTSSFAALKKAARRADVVLAFVGEEQIMSGEAHSLASLRLQGAQSGMLEMLAGGKTPLVTVIMAGRPLVVGKEAEMSDALLYAWHPGTVGGPALANIICGKVSPSGKLPVTFPRHEGQIPIYYNNKHTSHRAKGTEGNLDSVPREAVQSVMGHTSSYLDLDPSPLWPFGYGLSYTSFRLSDVRLDENEVATDGVLNLSVDVTNTGEREGAEVVQVYVGCRSASVTRPVRELKIFRRVTLAPGETRTVEISVPVAELAFCGADMQTRVEPGRYTLTVGTDSTSGESVQFIIR